MRVIRRLFSLSGAEWLALLRAVPALLRARIAYGRAPAQTLIRQLQARSDARAVSSTPGDDDVARVLRLRWALQAVGTRAPWRADCMIQVLAAERQLLRWGLSPKFFLGVDPKAPDGFGAHVWLQVGDQVVTGGPVKGMAVMIGDT